MKDIKDNNGNECFGRGDFASFIDIEEKGKGHDDWRTHPVHEYDQNIQHVDFLNKFEFGFPFAVEFLEEELLQSVYFYEFNNLHDFLDSRHSGIFSLEKIVIGACGQLHEDHRN